MRCATGSTRAPSRSVPPAAGEPAECEEALNHAAGFLRNGLFKRLHIHTVPTLHFVFDRTTERASDMNALIARAVASRSKIEE